MTWEERLREHEAGHRRRNPAEWQAGRERVRGLPVMELTYRGELTPPEAGDVLTGAPSLSPHGEPVALWATPEGHEEQVAKDSLPNGVRVPRTQLSSGVPLRFATYGGSGPVVTELATRLGVPAAQPLSGGRVLVVGARCVYDHERGPEQNAEIHGAGGELLTRGTFGDGIGDVRTDVDDGIWACYFTEGILGDNGWGRGLGGPDPIGASGLVRFRDDLTRDCPLPGVEPWGPPDENPWLALESTTAWATYRTMSEEVLVRFDPSEGREVCRGWSLGKAGKSRVVPLGPGSSAVAQVGGGFGAHDLLTYTTLEDDGRATPGARFRLALPGGGEVDRFTGHGHVGVLHVFAGRTWWSADLRELAASLP